MTDTEKQSLQPNDLVYWIVRGAALDQFVLLQYRVDGNDGQTILVQSLLDPGDTPWTYADFPMELTPKLAVERMRDVLLDVFRKDPSLQNAMYFLDFLQWARRVF